MRKTIGEAVYRVNHWWVWRWPVTIDGQRMVPPSADRLLHLWLNRAGWMNTIVRRTLDRLVKPGMTVLDIGANQGVFTLRLSSLVGETGRVHAFEPEPMLGEALRANLGRNQIANVTLHPLALGSAPGTLTLHRSATNSGDNRIDSAASFSQSISVTVDTLDRVLPGATIDFIKIDVQGHELKVFQGASELIDRSRALQILFEFWPAGIRLAGGEPADLLQWLSDRGFVLFDPNEPTTPRDIADWLTGGTADILAMRRD